MFGLKPVELDAADQAKMRDLNEKTTGVQRMVQMFVETGERRMAQLQREGSELFDSFGEKYKLDFTHVSYQPSPDGKTLVPTMVTLVKGGFNGTGKAE